MTNEERAMELYNALKKCYFNVEIIMRISTHDDEIRRECNDEVYRKMLSAELTKDHDRQIRNECAGSAVNDWFLNAQIDHNEKTLRSAIMGKEAGE